MRIRSLIIPLLFCLAIPLHAQGPQGRTFGFGIILGDPTGGTIKIWTTHENAFDFYIGGDYFSVLRIGGDYLWHFDAFRSSVVKLYAGIGGTIGFAAGRQYLFYHGNDDVWIYRPGGGPGFGVRAIMGLNVIPRNAPVEIFMELGPLIGIVPAVGTAFDIAIGVRFYP